MLRKWTYRISLLLLLGLMAAGCMASTADSDQELAQKEGATGLECQPRSDQDSCTSNPWCGWCWVGECLDIDERGSPVDRSCDTITSVVPEHGENAGSAGGASSRTRVVACSNFCASARDGACDDGATVAAFGGLANATSNECALGTDCDDCGARDLSNASLFRCPSFGGELDDCGACVSEPSCGFCFDDNSCRSGSSEGSYDGLCSEGNWQWGAGERC